MKILSDIDGANRLIEDSNNRLVSDTEKATWNGKGSSNLALGATSVTAYRGDYGNTAYTHSQAAHAPSDANNYVHPTTAGNIHIPAAGVAGQILRWSALGTATWGADTDTIYTHPTTAGNLHIPTGGATGQFLKYSASGTAVWSADNDTIYTHPANHPPTIITQDASNRFVTDTEKATWNGKVDSTHIHNAFDRQVTDFTGANIFSNITVVDGIVTAIGTRAMTTTDIGAGTTDGSITETGTNSNGTYIKFGSGIMICYNPAHSLTFSLTTITTGIFYTSVVPANISYAATFYAAPYVVANLQMGENIGVGIRENFTTYFNVRAYSSYLWPANTVKPLAYFAIGRWKA